ncbi:MAG: hypothetical protein KIT73_09480 [Burkholderiales bacterium]|nr:hypothetical protein [Burkholderiales bacterium]
MLSLLTLPACGLKGPLYLPDGSTPQGTLIVPTKVQK